MKVHQSASLWERCKKNLIYERNCLVYENVINVFYLTDQNYSCKYIEELETVEYKYYI